MKDISYSGSDRNKERRKERGVITEGEGERVR